MKKYQVITITNKRVLTETFNEEKIAYSLFRVAKYGFPEGERVEKIYLTKDDNIVAEQHYNDYRGA